MWKGNGKKAEKKQSEDKKATAAEVMVDRLIDWGVSVVFGLPGDGINGLMEALRKRQEQIRFIQVRHEEAAAFMACGYAKFTGRLVVCLATSGPGAIHLLNGLYDAKLDGAALPCSPSLVRHTMTFSACIISKRSICFLSSKMLRCSISNSWEPVMLAASSMRRIVPRSRRRVWRM